MPNVCYQSNKSEEAKLNRPNERGSIDIIDQNLIGQNRFRQNEFR